MKQQTGARAYSDTSRSGYADAYSRLGRDREATDAARAAVAVETDNLLDHGEAWLSLAGAAGRAGRRSEALDALRRALEAFEQKRAASPMRRARLLLDQYERGGVWPPD